MYRLKKGQEAFQVVDGSFAKRRYRHGIEYKAADVPPQEKHRFEPAYAKATARQQAKSNEQKAKGKNQVAEAKK